MVKVFDQLRQLKINQNNSLDSILKRTLQLGEIPYLSSSDLKLIKQREKI